MNIPTIDEQLLLLDYILFNLLHLDPDDCLIFGSTIARLMELIPGFSNDVDIAIIGKSWNRFYNTFKNIHKFNKSKLGGLIVQIDNFEFSNIIGLDMDDIIFKEKITYKYKRLRFISINNLVKFKLKMDRPKDRKHLSFINSKLKRS